MTTTRVTVSLPAELAAKLKTEAGERSVSAYVAEIIEGHLEEAKLGRLWNEYLDDVGVTAGDIASAKRDLDELLRPSTNDAA